MAENCGNKVGFDGRGLTTQDANGNCQPLNIKINQSGLTRGAIIKIIEKWAHFGPIYFLDKSTGDYWKFDVSQDGLGNMEQTNVGPNPPIV